MIGWSTINPVLVRIFTELATDTTRLAEGFEAEWHEGKRGFTSPYQRVSLLLKVTTVAALGEDETRYDDDMASAQTGQRRVTLQIQAIVPEHTDEQWAMATLERIRARIRRPRVIDELLSLDVALIRVTDARKVSFKDHSRVVSAGTMDVLLGMVSYDEDPINGGWIERVEITSHTQNTDGVELPAGAQLVDHLIPPA